MLRVLSYANRGKHDSSMNQSQNIICSTNSLGHGRGTNVTAHVSDKADPDSLNMITAINTMINTVSNNTINDSTIINDSIINHTIINHIIKNNTIIINSYYCSP